EYYRFRAFFEPHDVRNDPVSALTKTEKDATLGQVPADGIPLVYDKTPDAPTYVLQRGDSRYPDESKPVIPGVPAALGGNLTVTPVSLPAEMWFPMLRADVRESVVAKADADAASARQNLDAAQKAFTAAEHKLTAATASNHSPADNAVAPEIVLNENFAKARPDLWETVSGTWAWEDGKLIQSAVTSFATMVTKNSLPSDVHIHLRYRPLSPGTYRSVGFSLDYLDRGNSQDIYTSTGDSRQSVQAFHRVDGKQEYPQAGIVPAMLKVGEEAVLDVSVIGSGLTIDLNGERRLEYTMPVKRRDGRFALWVHQGAAEFLELRITKHAESPETLARKLHDAQRAVEVAEAEHSLAAAEAESVRRRLAADLQIHLSPAADSDEATAVLSRRARQAELAVAVCTAQLEVIQAADDEQKRDAAMQALAAAQQAEQAVEGDYTSVGEQFPRTSTGRRSALAAWIAGDENPRTARVAVNHIWGRHFGRPLVTTPENFGLNGRQPSHPKLLDWLAAELTAGGWSMKSLHRQIVLSATYRMSGSAPESSAGGGAGHADPENLYLWRMPSRRMEAEVVRDSTLYLAGRLDLTPGGPELPETDGGTTLRRSLYFRNTPNEKMAMLEVFDVADPNGCYRRRESVVPHQSLALMNSGPALDSARLLAEQLAGEDDFVTAAFETILCRRPTAQETEGCTRFLDEHSTLLAAESGPVFAPGGSAGKPAASDPMLRAKENLVHVLFLHNDFVTIR
ncbi:MAG: DUF1553 domain-containing protein, partial [Planctomycetaceae bacterium]|nr:DUF1553 domain-containing protein [Planctomycetaceae bacterium]